MHDIPLFLFFFTTSTRITHIARSTSTLRLFTLTLTTPHFTFKPGQWLDVHVPTPAAPSPGGFTIISPPSLLPRLQLAIQAAPHNPPAAWLWQHEPLIEGKEVKVRAGGNFTFPPPEESGVAGGIGHVVFVAAGVGVNPLLSMLRYIQESEKDLEVSFLWSTKTPVPEAYMSVLSALDEPSFKLFITGAKDEAATVTDEAVPAAAEEEEAVKWPHETRRMTVEDVKAVVELGPAEETVVYVCGPPPFTETFVEGVVARTGLGRERVFMERWW
ncbi:ferredoxin reductase-like protein [Morchella conica CCBAS932]|uniref:Oxidoreductase NAD-binding domain-containing protein 1 n=1 Tax=Morchella conica CCBAS932 TaxID=1392247 RepID=A0A3N4L3K3_9PEZI|nr:ferredoxin reductase-like protein [Morchella conica CCBAS932]